MNLRSIDQAALVLLHHECIKTYGGSTGVKDAQLLEASLARPLNLATHEEQNIELDIAALAASYGIGIIRNQPFVDGNKRAAFLAIGLFLYVNGWSLIASQIDATRAMQALASGDMDEVMLADWIRSNL